MVKKTIFFIIMILLTNYAIYASGMAEQQSQALLYKQKKVTWDSAPESAVFYECYIVKTQNREGEIITVLLDIYELNNPSFIESNVLIINPITSMEISVSNVNEMLEDKNIIYKCIVLYQISMFGTARVHIFNAEPAVQLIGYLSIYSLLLLNILDDNDMQIVNYICNYYYCQDLSLYVYFPQLKHIFLQLDQWPNPTEFNTVDEISLFRLIHDDEIFHLDNELEVEADRWSNEQIEFYENLRFTFYSMLSEEEKIFIRNNPVIPILCQFNNYPIVFFNNDRNRWQGIALDLLVKIESLTGLSFSIVNDFGIIESVLVEMLENGKASLLVTLNRSSENEERFLWAISENTILGFNRNETILNSIVLKVLSVIN